MCEKSSSLASDWRASPSAMVVRLTATSDPDSVRCRFLKNVTIAALQLPCCGQQARLEEMASGEEKEYTESEEEDSDESWSGPSLRTPAHFFETLSAGSPGITVDALESYLRGKGIESKLAARVAGMMDGDSDGAVSMADFTARFGLFLAVETGQSFTGIKREKCCRIPDTALRAIELEQLQAVVRHMEHRLELEEWVDFQGAVLHGDTVTLYDMVNYVILPATAADQCSMVELMTAAEEQPPDYFCSHVS